MKNILLLLGMLLSAQFLPGQSVERYSRVYIDIQGHSIGELAALGIETDHGKYEPGRDLTTELSESEIQRVQHAGFLVTVLIPDLKKWYLEQKDKKLPVKSRGNTCGGSLDPVIRDWKTPANYVHGSMGGYQTYAEMLSVLDDMRAKFPNLISERAPLSDTILTHEGRPVWWVRISDNAGTDEPEPEMLYNALHHAREPNSMSQMLFYMWYLLENYDQDPDIKYLVDHTELYFIPCVNPDGYLYNEATSPQGGGFWRKNRRDNGDGTFGVDLNRNYGYEWAANDQGSSPNSNAETYRGPAPFSEPETRMIRDFCLQHDFKFTLNYHTYGNHLIYPWSYNDEIADPAFVDLAKVFSFENKYNTGTSIQTVGYPVNGNSDDWMFGSAGIFAFTPEVGPVDYGFWPPETAIDSLNKMNMWQNLIPAFCLLRYGKVTDLGSQTVDMSNPKIEFRLQRLGFDDGPFTISLKALTPNIASVSAPITIQLNQFASVDSTFSLDIVSGVQSGEKAVFVLELDNGQMISRDTLRKTLLGPEMPVFIEPGNAPLSQWDVFSGTWGTTASDYVSAPTSITDSPDGLYEAGVVNVLEMNSAVLVPGTAQSAQLRFFAHWAIERGYDYVQVFASSPDLGARALCGRYTKPGTDFQSSGEPVFDGFQDTWVEECMDLSDFIGQPITLQFILVSDGFLEYDGFYFDDLRIEYTQPGFVGVTPIALNRFDLRQNRPNPASGFTQISWDRPNFEAGAAELQVFTFLGEPVLIQPLDLNNQTQFLLDTRNLAPGQYTYTIRTATGQTLPRKMTVMHP